MLFATDAPKVDLVLRGARVLDPGEGIDAALDVTVEQGVITRIEPGSSPNG